MHYVWLWWSLFLVAIWLVIYLALPVKEQRREMLMVSMWTSLLGFTEPFFVPAYWMPPSLFDLAARTGFDIESFIFSFGIGGIAVILYELLFRVRDVSVPKDERHATRHRYHRLALVSAPVIFLVLYATNVMNPMYAALLALLGGGVAQWYCRPDLTRKMATGAFLFAALYAAYFFVLIALAPGYVESVWNLSALSGVMFLGIPAEEILFALGFGVLWSGVYEHFAWKRLSAV